MSGHRRVLLVFFVGILFFLPCSLTKAQEEQKVKIGDWVKFRVKEDEIPSAAEVVAIRGTQVIVRYQNPVNKSTSRLSIQKGRWQIVSKEEAEEINSDGWGGVNQNIEVGDRVRVFNRSVWFLGNVVAMPNIKMVRISYIHPETKEALEDTFIRRSVRPYNDRSSYPEFRSGDKVLVKVKEAGKVDWILGEIDKIAGNYVYVMLDKNKTDPQAEITTFLMSHISHLTGKDLKKYLPEKANKFEVGALVDFKLNGSIAQGTIIKIARSGTFTIRYFDTNTGAYAEKKVSKRGVFQPNEYKGVNPLTSSRTWKSANGKFEFVGALISINGEKVKIRNDDGKLVTVELSKLCPDDIELVESLK